jgi:hypothetical protein
MRGEQRGDDPRVPMSVDGPKAAVPECLLSRRCCRQVRDAPQRLRDGRVGAFPSRPGPAKPPVGLSSLGGQLWGFRTIPRKSL